MSIRHLFFGMALCLFSNSPLGAQLNDRTWVSIHVDEVRIPENGAFSPTAEFRLLMLATHGSGHSSYFAYSDEGILRVSRDQPAKLEDHGLVQFVGSDSRIPVFIVAIDRDTDSTTFNRSAIAFLSFAETHFPKTDYADGMAVIKTLESKADAMKQDEVLRFIRGNRFFGEVFTILEVSEESSRPHIILSPNDEIQYTLTVRKTTGRYAVQIIASKDGVRADEILESFRGKGYAGFLTTDRGKAPLFRVRIGPFEERFLAEEAMKKVAQTAGELNMRLGKLHVVDLFKTLPIPPLRPAGRLFVQLTSLEDKDMAQKVRDHADALLKESGIHGYQAFISPVEVDGKYKFRVQVGFFEKSEPASEVRNILKGGEYKLEPRIMEPTAMPGEER